LREKYAGFYTEITTLLGDAKTVTDAKNPEHQKQAREVRLGLKRVRCDVERARKDLKDESVRYGKAVDGYANVLKFLCEPVEADLLRIEQYAERIEAARIQKIIDERTAILESLDCDAKSYNLGQMDEKQFEGVRKMAARQKEEREEAAAKAEADRLAKEKAEADERKRIEAENKKYKAELAKKEAQQKKEREAERKKLLAEREKREAAEAEAAALKAEQEQAEAKAEAERLRIEQAPDKVKLLAIASVLLDIKTPKFDTEEGEDIGILSIKKIDIVAEWIREKASSL